MHKPPLLRPFLCFLFYPTTGPFQPLCIFLTRSFHSSIVFLLPPPPSYFALYLLLPIGYILFILFQLLARFFLSVFEACSFQPPTSTQSTLFIVKTSFCNLLFSFFRFSPMRFPSPKCFNSLSLSLPLSFQSAFSVSLPFRCNSIYLLVSSFFILFHSLPSLLCGFVRQDRVLAYLEEISFLHKSLLHSRSDSIPRRYKLMRAEPRLPTV